MALPPANLTSNCPLTAVDLFSGAGGFSLAAKRVGINVLAALEVSPYACKTYKENFCKDPSNAPVLLERDILSITPHEFSDCTKIRQNTLDILMGGPPCQGYSTHRINDAGVDDPRNKLLIRYFDFISYLAPRAFIVENVPGMLWPRHQGYVKQFYNLALAAGYHIAPPIILNAQDYGVPQNRKRVFILGTRDALCAGLWPPPKTHFSPRSKQVLAGEALAWVNAAKVFDRPLELNDPNNIHMNHGPALIEVFRSTPLNGGSRYQSSRILPCHKEHNGHKDVYGRIDPARPGPTMTTACTNPSKGRFLHPTENHGITVRHAARFQTFPDDFVFIGGLMASSQQVGNAVPIKLGEAVLRCIAQILHDK